MSPDVIRTMGEGAEALFVQSVNDLRRMHRARAARAEGAYRLDSPLRRAALALAETTRCEALSREVIRRQKIQILSLQRRCSFKEAEGIYAREFWSGGEPKVT